MYSYASKIFSILNKIKIGSYINFGNYSQLLFNLTIPNTKIYDKALNKI